MHIDLLGLQAFLAVADTGNFRHAADKLAISQPALTRRIQRLERIVGCSLIVRTTRPVRLTKEGETLLPQVQGTLGDLALSIKEVASRDKAPTLNIAVLPTIAARYLGECISEFRRRWPSQSLRVHDVSQTEIFELLRHEKVEFAVASVTSDRWDIHGVALFDDPFFLVCRRDHPYAVLPQISWSELAGQPLIAIGPMSGNRRAIELALDRAGVSLSWQYEVQHLGTALELVLNNAGLTVLPREAVSKANREKAVLVPLVAPVVSRTIGILQRRGHELSPAARAFRDVLRRAMTPDRMRQPDG